MKISYTSQQLTRLVLSAYLGSILFIYPTLHGSAAPTHSLDIDATSAASQSYNGTTTQQIMQTLPASVQSTIRSLPNLNYSLLPKYRHSFFPIWGSRIGRAFTAGETSARYDIEIQLHHLAGNAIHILSMLANPTYKANMRMIERSNGRITYAASDIYAGKYIGYSDYDEPADIVHNRDSLQDLRTILNLVQSWDTASINDIISFQTQIKQTERDMLPYRHQRKLTLKIHRVENPMYQGLDDDDEPRSIALNTIYSKADLEKRKTEEGLNLWTTLW